MFTGLIEEVGTLLSLRPIGPGQLELKVGCGRINPGLKLGDSVAVDGVCLTVVSFDSRSVAFELSGETVQKSRFGGLKAGARLNLEQALRLGDRLGGHLVQGHVDGLGHLGGVKKEGEFYSLTFTYPAPISRYLIPKGSVAVNGISLTVASLESDRFTVAIIPHTYQETNLRELKPKDPVHLETDLIGRYVERLLPFAQAPAKASSLNDAFLKENGFF
ncbi:MAG: riboflavin synthase subunit alpha [Candidatus Lambdaproteobacteria bacterium RIFOXYD1_FULL_56_27]|uniref:Riboflavin synthase n=1 Tax=Candidatus Lambdaproteobacteria bacterium RIFOXYD2_FULL_56_26 TaxID=1817773 RepID=A0A1F6H404_9PROT|nr:MAG: riboflavin synthase subunit alpha [Candidatus Lambdaproteobacteria bacterium RIFOXYC1_FULL_56_13]OGH05066.1 MAG: riboflavin synthase subunit alpha [Candidatus Lambdaproteobacteria bacterium RIFOXYD2_FULL_56_26]OGH09531.1 MAG: riboflavin synthase subunit alpha [Candidatus Lambdaproteobacteria bacterium RIFOXYD1_FULL_56_27]